MIFEAFADEDLDLKLAFKKISALAKSKVSPEWSVVVAYTDAYTAG